MLSQAYLHKPDAKPRPSSNSPPTSLPAKLPTYSYPSASIQEQSNPWVADVETQPAAKAPFVSLVFGDDPALSQQQGSLSSTFANNYPPSSSSFVILPPTETTVAEILPKPSKGNEEYDSLGLSISSQINKGKETGAKDDLSQSIQSQITAGKKTGSRKDKKKKKRPKRKKGVKKNKKLKGNKKNEKFNGYSISFGQRV